MTHTAILLCVLLPQIVAAEEKAVAANHLINESSPYLLQHAYNPVDWYPWGEAAFAKAKKEDKPILLSIGYSTCHWCHVMEEESYSDADVAKAINESFIAIKVDREERPDIDQVYMQAAQVMMGSGGWPLNILMTADKQPFYAATYLPKHGRFGRMGMIELAQRVHELWQHDRQQLLEPASRLQAKLNRMNVADSRRATVDKSTIDKAYQEFAASFDAEHGGFAAAPKFPSPHKLLFLLRYWHQTGEKQALQMVEKTLQAMRAGGVYDQVGFGFHRYATDSHWRLPHFEKMLYDQAMLILLYTEAYQATGKQVYASTVQEIITYVMRDMHDESGAFYSAEDADAEGVEGKFHMWTLKELIQVLGKDDADFAALHYGVLAAGNVHDEATGKKTGANVLYQAIIPASSKDKQRLEAMRQKLFTVREQRVRPFRDDKILTDWNGLMIAALAKAGRALQQPAYIKAARQTADFLLQHMQRKDGRLWHRYRQGKIGIEAHLDDYSFLIWGLLELYESDFEPKDLQAALALNEILFKHFKASQGGFYFTADDAEAMLVRSLDAYDGALPSGNSVALMNLVRLARMTGVTALEEQADATIQAFSKSLSVMPSAFSYMMSAVMLAEYPSFEVVLAGERQSQGGQQMLAAIRSVYMPNKVVLWQADGLQNIAAYTAGQKALAGKATAYICRNFQCNLPTSQPQQAVKLLREKQ